MFDLKIKLEMGYDIYDLIKKSTVIICSIYGVILIISQNIMNLNDTRNVLISCFPLLILNVLFNSLNEYLYRIGYYHRLIGDI